MATPDIILYTNHRCPWAHRAHIALAELGLPFKEEIIDLNTPRTAEYLAINPRGLVPSIKYNGEIITESAIVAQFLADNHPSHLVKATSDKGGALQRARINFFVDAWVSKVNSGLFGAIRAQSEQDRLEATEKFVAAIEKEIEPLLADAAPFFGGSSKLTLAEVQLGSFALRVWDSPSYDLLPGTLFKDLDERAPNTLKWLRAVVKEKSVNHIWDAKGVAEATKARLAQQAKV